MTLLHSHDVQVHEVTVHLPVSWWRVPATHGQDLQALHRLLEVLKSLVKGNTFKKNQSLIPLLTLRVLFV